jgi:hypothetical protein
MNGFSGPRVARASRFRRCGPKIAVGHPEGAEPCTVWHRAEGV